MAPNRKSWKKVAGSIRSPIRNPSTIADATFSVAVQVIPAGFVSAPILYGTYEGIRFVLLVREQGLEKAVEKTAVRISEKYFIPSLSQSLWDLASSKIDTKYVNSPFGKMAEIAFKKTLNSVMIKGVKALEGGT